MDMNKLTQKSQEALTAAQSRAITFGHQEVAGEHLTLALLEQPDGLIGSLFRKMDVSVEGMVAALEVELRQLPKVTGAGYQPANPPGHTRCWRYHATASSTRTIRGPCISCAACSNTSDSAVAPTLSHTNSAVIAAPISHTAR